MSTAAYSARPCAGILVASPNSDFRKEVLSSFPDHEPFVQQVSGGADALAQLENGSWKTLYLDRRLADLDAEELVLMIGRRFPTTRVVVVDSKPNLGRATIESTLAEPTNPHANRTIESLPGMVGRSALMQRLYRLTRLIAPRSTTVLIMGPTGTGKELVARAIHQLSRRASQPLVTVNCAAIPESLLESELFGYARGAFSGAVQSYTGRILAAQGGTIFLDEIGEMPLGLQAKLLRFLDQKEVQRLGTAEVAYADVRVIAATNCDLARRAADGLFREDLYYRLSAFPLELPSLRERVEDILPLAECFLAGLAKASHLPLAKLSTKAAALLLNHAWRGNVRELQLVMERALILAGDGIDNEGASIEPEHLWLRSVAKPPARVDGSSYSAIPARLYEKNLSL